MSKFKYLILRSAFLFLCLNTHVYSNSLEEGIVKDYQNFRKYSYNIPDLHNIVAYPVKYVSYLHSQLLEAQDRKVIKKLSKKISAIVINGVGFGGISDQEATEEERKILLGAFYSASKNHPTFVSQIFRDEAVQPYLTEHYRVLYSIYEVSKDSNFKLDSLNFFTDMQSYRSLSDYASKVYQDKFAGQGTSPSPIPTIDLTNNDTPAFFQPFVNQQINPTYRVNNLFLGHDRGDINYSAIPSPQIVHSSSTRVDWNTVNASILSNLYERQHNSKLVDNHRILEGKSFPMPLIAPPSNWQELVRKCAEGRMTSNLSPHYIYTDICFNIAKQLGWISPGGEDFSNPGRQARHIANEMNRVNGIGLDEAKNLFNNLGYPLKKVRERKGFRSGKEIVDF